MTEKGIIDSVMVTPASSPDINPIENVWSTMKDFLQREIKPKTKQQLVDGIIAYWDTLTTSKCRTFIDHIHKVMPVSAEQWQCYRLLTFSTSAVWCSL